MIWSVGKMFVANGALDASGHLLRERERIVLDDRDREVLFEALAGPPEPNAVLRRAVAVQACTTAGPSPFAWARASCRDWIRSSPNVLISPPSENNPIGRLVFRVSTCDISCTMIRSFRCKDTERLANGHRVRRFAGFERVAQRKLAQLDAATTLDFLRAPPGNRLEALRGDRAGSYSIRINDQWRLCFRFTNGNAHDAEIVDYH